MVDTVDAVYCVEVDTVGEVRYPEVRVVLVGIGAIGSEIARLLLRKTGVSIVGAVDPAPDKAGRDLGDVVGVGEKLGVMVVRSIDEINVDADVAIHATTSFLDRAYPQIVKLIERGLDVISTCEELSYPYIVDEELAKNLDELARKHNVTVLGTGINPGFVMDTLVIFLTAVCQDIKRIRVERVMDAGKRRLQFQRKIGAGLTLDEFRRKISSGEITGHVGLRQSIALIADALRWRLDKIVEEPAKPIVADREVSSSFITVKPGSVAGLSQVAYGVYRGEPAIILDFKAYIGASEEYDSIDMEGTPTIRERIAPCIHGDIGTAAIIVNSIPKVLNASPGLKTMKDLQVPSAVLEDMRLYVDGELHIRGVNLA
ncbi:MAG: hypothetical protein QXQ29_01870 [Candidatus Bathyarchaeia archaeon]